MLPLHQRLKKQNHKDLALAQDLIIKELYVFFPRAVLHGGTGIWRCYGGQRFSEDLDVYLPRDETPLLALFAQLEKVGFRVVKRKIIKNSLYSKLQFQRAEVRLEALFKAKEGASVLKEYETAEGSFATVYTLSPEQFVQEKVAAYLNRKKIRDLYDIFFLLRLVKTKEAVLPDLQLLLAQTPKPVDEQELRVLIFEGPTPTVDKMIQYIKDWI